MNITYCQCGTCRGKGYYIDVREPCHFSNVSTPWAVHCPTDGLVYLSNHGYNIQMNRADAVWMCPMCGRSAQWSDNLYEKHLEELDEEALKQEELENNREPEGA